MIGAGAVSEVELAAFVAALEGRDRAAALEVARRAYAAGATIPDLITNLFGAAQREVGRRWAVGEWNVGQEHAATAIVEQVMQAISSLETTTSRRGRVTVICAEGEFHALPAKMAAEYLFAEGWSADFLGVSVPRDALVNFLSDTQPVALLVSCSISTNLRGAMEAFGVAHGLGIPALAGGSGFGRDASHAVALGADAWASSPGEVSAVLDDWAKNKPALSRPRVPLYGEHVELRVQREALLTTTMAALAIDFPELSAVGQPGATKVREDLALVIDYLVAALLVDDPEVFNEFVAWWRSAYEPTGGQPELLEASLRVLAATLPESMPLARALVVESGRR